MNDANYMTCEKMSARMPISTCLGRQTRGIGRRDEGPLFIPDECRDCHQGQEILAVVRDPERAVQASGIENNELKEVKMVKKACRNCGRVKAIVKRGYCFVCSNAISGMQDTAQIVRVLAETKRKIETGEIRTLSRRNSVEIDGLSVPPGKNQPTESLPERVSDRLPAPGGEDGWKTGTLLMAQGPRIIPIILKLEIDITVRVNQLTA